MSAWAHTIIGAAEGAGARIAWVVVYVLCWCCVVLPFVVWYAGVRTPRAQRTARPGPAAAPDVAAGQPHEQPDERAAG